MTHSDQPSTAASSEEKRRYARYANQQIELEVARPGIKGMITTNPSVQCLNFSRMGLRFDSPQKLETGEKLLIDIAIDDIALRDIQAEVVFGQPGESGNWCYGTRFCLESSTMNKPEIHLGLLRIEDKLKSQSEFGYPDWD